MSRVMYNEDDRWAGIRWAGAAKKAIFGKRGQSLLRELEAALLALPEKKLIANDFATSTGEVCALGALAKARGVPLDEITRWEDEPETAAEKLDMTFTLAWEVISQNDDKGYVYFRPTDWTPEQRYQHVLAWVQRHIKPESANIRPGKRLPPKCSPRRRRSQVPWRRYRARRPGQSSPSKQSWHDSLLAVR